MVVRKKLEHSRRASRFKWYVLMSFCMRVNVFDCIEVRNIAPDLQNTDAELALIWFLAYDSLLHTCNPRANCDFLRSLVWHKLYAACSFLTISAGTSHSPSFILRLSGSSETPKILALCRCIVYVLKYMTVCSQTFLHSPGHTLAHDAFRLLFCLASNLMCTDFNACNRKHLRITIWADTETPEPWKSGES